jgi:ketosteroid isomerase-like protein
MSQENVEVVRTCVKVWNAGDMEGVLELYDPDAVMEVVPDWPEPGPFVGRDAVMQQLSQARGAFDSDSLEFLSDLVAVGDRVITRAAGTASDVAPRATWSGATSSPSATVASST